MDLPDLSSHQSCFFNITIIAEAATLLLPDMAKVPPLRELDSYKLTRVKGPDEVNWNMSNIQRSLRFSDSLFKATGDHCISALQTKNMRGVNIRLGDWSAKKEHLRYDRSGDDQLITITG